ncbi:N-acetyl sugar amidotransferase [Massilia cavernae]|uniref:N-acetyl sugar amidotransferase n=1 Tax=Massilia cavernae TaxID=2320864 RepID=A0A418Y6G5_9BURK|nr:N-acetyl sugar amidotransferase [Massilia cavernae]RJG23854.1 N-acetyl sugar amidotransferase [Massilia cavernae]
MKRCTKCLTKETVDTITYDEFGVCSVCRQVEFKKEKIDWVARGEELQQIIARHKGVGIYDCVVPYSGGKDSVFQLWYIVKELKLKPLVVRYNHWGYRPLVDENNTKVFKQLGVDVVELTTSFHVVRELMLESLKRRGDFCWHCHTGIYAGVMHIALRFETPLIFWGESTAEYHSWYTFEEMEVVDEKRFNRLMNQGMTADDMYEFLQGRVDRRDLWMFDYPKRKDLIKLKVESICLGNYIEWNTKKQVELIKSELGWKGQPVEGVPPAYDYEKIECTFQGMRDFAKFVKRGYGRTNHLATIDIRNGELSREDALALEAEYDGKRPASIDWFLNILQISEAEFYEILQKHQVHPWNFDPATIETGKPMPDMPQWDNTLVDKSIGAAKDEGGRTAKYV